MHPFSTSSSSAFIVLNPPQFPTTPKQLCFPPKPNPTKPSSYPPQRYHLSKSSPASPHAVSIEKEVLESERPDTFLRESDSGNVAVSTGSVRARFEKMIREVQDRVCEAIKELDGGGSFKEDVWSRPGGGGGISRVLLDGSVFEKAGVNVYVVYGVGGNERVSAVNLSQALFIWSGACKSL